MRPITCIQAIFVIIVALHICTFDRCCYLSSDKLADRKFVKQRIEKLVSQNPNPAGPAYVAAAADEGANKAPTAYM